MLENMKISDFEKKKFMDGNKEIEEVFG